jgi:NAD(P)-dependent dehydrogenase (short-subunit alcohol dehydrogenase family)
MGQRDDEVAVITGGESGIGLESARLFCQEGARVHLIGLQQELLEEAVDSLGPERASASVADVTDEGAVRDAIEMAATGLPQAEAAAVFDGMIPLGRHTTPREVAQAALYLASDASAMVTSTTFAIDGGLSG